MKVAIGSIKRIRQIRTMSIEHRIGGGLLKRFFIVNLLIFAPLFTETERSKRNENPPEKEQKNTLLACMCSALAVVTPPTSPSLSVYASCIMQLRQNQSSSTLNFLNYYYIFMYLKISCVSVSQCISSWIVSIGTR